MRNSPLSKLPLSVRSMLAVPLLPLGLTGLLLWGVGSAIADAGKWIWMGTHWLFRKPDCICGECREFFGAKPPAVEPPAAA